MQTLTTIGTTSNSVAVSYSRGGDLFALNGPASNIKGTTAIGANDTSLLLTSTSESAANAEGGWLNVLTISSTNKVGPLWSMAANATILKVGDSFSYTAGYKIYASSTATVATNQAVGSG